MSRKLFRFPRPTDPPPGDSLPKTVPGLIWHFSRMFWPHLLVVMALAAVTASLGTLVPYFLKLFVDGINTATPETLWQTLGVPFALFVILWLVRPLLEYANEWYRAHLYPSTLNLMRRHLALYMHGHSYDYFQSDFAGRLASKVVETPMALNFLFRELTSSLWNAVVIWITAAGVLGSAHWSLAAFLLVWLVLYIALLLVRVPKVAGAAKQVADANSVVRGRYVDTLTNILTVKLFSRQKHEDAYLTEALEDSTGSIFNLRSTIMRMNLPLNLMLSALIVGLTGYALYGWQVGFLTAGDVAMALPMAVAISNFSWWLKETFTMVFERYGEVADGLETIGRARSVIDIPHAPRLLVRPGAGAIELRDVTFSYGGRAPVFSGLSLNIPAGQKVGVVGPSGAGKSTLIQLLVRLFDVEGGAIYIDGTNIAQVSQNSLRENISVIPQTTDLLHRPVMENIRYGNLGATEADVYTAARKARAHDFIRDLKDPRGHTGYDVLVGERGVRLSGGQRQRIAIARAFIKDAPILLLDEATSALDSESEHVVQQALVGLMRHRTVLAVAHRLSTVRAMDRILVMDEGHIVEDGTHNQLLAKNGLYARLWRMQSR